jgi:uncharacterized repeat protein (TIGR03803 family)
MEKRNRWERICVLSAFCAAAVTAASAQTFTVIKHFNGANGRGPSGTLAQGLDGNLYGTTTSGGTNNHGTVFRISTAGTLNKLYSFCRLPGCPDGDQPNGGLLLGTDGNFYGTARLGGTGSGTLFKIPLGGRLSTLYTFCSQADCVDGTLPNGSLVQGADGNLYGTTGGGGIEGLGTVYRITTTGSLTSLLDFCNFFFCNLGQVPFGGLAVGFDGTFYGTTHGGGTNSSGTIYSLTSLEATGLLYNFCSFSGCTDGSLPQAGLVQGSDGNLYGTTFSGGTSNNCPFGCGTVFKITPGGVLTTLHSFASFDGAAPNAELTEGSDGNFYGTTTNGGTFNKGTAFRITPSGALTTLVSLFTSAGTTPFGGLLQATDGNFYGTAADGGGGSQNGSIFRVSMGLAPFVKTLPTSGSVGSAVIILGTNLTGTTSVTFNGMPATFTVVSATEITTNVPAGAITGQVQVITPGGTLSSTPVFQVLP